MNGRKHTRGRRIQYIEIERLKEKRPFKSTVEMDAVDVIKEVVLRIYGDRIGPRRFKRIFHCS